MVSLKPMSDNEFADFLAYFIPDYAAEIAVNYRLTHHQALIQARSEIACSLPDGEKSAGHCLMSIFLQQNQENEHIGYLWYKPDHATKSAFIYDFYLSPAQRNKGLGSAAMQCLETALAQDGFTQIKLRVAAENDHARKVYESNGYQITGFNMNKLL